MDRQKVREYEGITHKAGNTSEEDNDRLVMEDSEEEMLRAQAKSRMMDGYKRMMKNYDKQMQSLSQRPQWVHPRRDNAPPPHELTITHVNQTHNLVTASDIEAANAEAQSTGEWLKTHSVAHLKLTMKNLVDKGKIARPGTNQTTGKVQQHLQFESTDINEFEYKLNLAIETYTKRIKWLLHGSKRTFGLVKGSKVAVLVDASDANCGFGRLTTFQESLVHWVDEQLAEKESLYLVSFGTDYQNLWKDMRLVNCRIIKEAKEWVSNLEPSGGCNLLRALKHVTKLPDINSIVIVLGSVPDQASNVIVDYVSQMAVGKDIPLHTVAYDCSNHLTNTTLRKLAEESGGRYHCYASTCEEQIYTGTDISQLLKEIQTAQDVINKIKEMRQGMLGTALVSVMNEISNEVGKLPQSRFLPRPPGHELPLMLEMPKFLATTSAKWLQQQGLKAKRLDLYQVLAPNAYSFKEEFIPVIRKTVQSQVHERSMAQFTWHDGSVKNVHVDMSQLFEYQKQLGSSVRLFEKRIDWLSAGSRRIFGTVSEKNVVIMVDLSTANTTYLVHIQHSLRLLMEQQMANKEYFNIIALGTETKKFRETMVKAIPENLQKAWMWVLDLQCGGSRDVLSALHAAVQNDEEEKHNIEVEGIYLFTSGIPDQPTDVICAFMEESCAGRDLTLNVILFNIDDYDANGAIPGRYANITKTADSLRSLSHCTRGRFHWFRETGIIESDDISEITAEIEKAINFSRKCAMLVESVKEKYKISVPDCYYKELKMLPSSSTPKSLLAPKSTALSSARQQLAIESKESSSPKSLQGRPSSAKKSEQQTDIKPKRPSSAKDPMQRVRSHSKRNVTQKAFFYTDDKTKGANVGYVFRKYPAQKSVRKQILDHAIPEKEEQVTTKEWLRHYSLNKLKLDLNKLVSGPDCKHVDRHVKSLHKRVDAKYCNIFPSVNVKGSLKHLQLQPRELADYEEQIEKVLRRYIKRLQFLLSGSRRVFGTVVHQKVAVLIDTSGSMDPYLDELKKELASLIWDQLYRYGAKFNLIRFSKFCDKWRPNLVDPSESDCHDAIKYVSSFVAAGNTCTLEALQMAFDDPGTEAIYLLSDGKPDTSTAMVLREVARMNANRNVVINTISFNCEDSTANNFLKMLAQETGGRYHRCHSDFDAHMFAHKLLTEGFQDAQYPHLPEFEGDDLRILAAEISKARGFLAQAKQFRAMYSNQNNEQQEKSNVKKENIVTVGPGRPRPVSSAA